MFKLFAILFLATACGGAEFSVADETIAAGAGGEEPAGIAGSGGQSVGMAGTAGATSMATAGSGSGGSLAGSAGSMPGSAGAPASKCEFSENLIAPALPSSFTWDSFTYTNGDTCVRCQHSPCQEFTFVWGTPMHNDDGSYTFLPSTNQPMVSLSFGSNDGACAETTMCGVKATNPSLTLFVEKQGSSWVIAKAQLGMSFADNACVRTASPMSPTGAMYADIDEEFSDSLKGRKLGCANP